MVDIIRAVVLVWAIRVAIRTIIILITSFTLSGDLFKLTYPDINCPLTNPFNYILILLTALVS